MSCSEIPNKTFTRQSIIGKKPTIFTNVYQKDTNIIIWQRHLCAKITSAVNSFIQSNKKATVLAVTPENTHQVLYQEFGKTESITTLSDDIALLVDMFCCLFDLPRAGLRLNILDRAMCPRFHVDHIPCRLVTTYQGIATEWLNHNDVDRTKLGSGNNGKPDEQSGLFQDLQSINRLSAGDVALLKGENWDNTKGAGLVHRSPPVQAGEKRLLLTLDFLSD
ncbi:DUF1826 domain-containing protein [Thalassotalea sp. 1_MG-2023]|uniref:DUF1826 domain-containing protein n=1 Tax=Thalassotalea sp. 1_MG-2023 TaxID=3062680 RepID=UPI0026E14B8E|nr:DUF1826 domain-containing protein [Thalassotalea sp. 1_MG-2023]MDO6425796.1 DUF1826 domain-containing protein [Thalassotalea sp. 1_MG-2023]